MKKLMISGSQKAKIINLYLHNITQRPLDVLIEGVRGRQCPDD